jgi:LysM repeat protein
MTTGRIDRGPVRIRRRGRHSAPTPIEKVAQQAGKAAPAVAIAGALVAAPQASHALAASAKPVAVTAQSHTTAATTTSPTSHAATLDSVSTRSVTVTAAGQARHAAQAQSTTYRVAGGDTLSKIAGKFFHNNDWQYLYHANVKTVSDPNVIYVGQHLLIPASAPAHYTLTDYVPRHAKPAASTARTVSTTSSGSRSSSANHSHSSGSSVTGTAHGGTAAVQSASQGRYSCSGLELIWEQAGGSPARAMMAAEIAMAESGGNPNAISPTDDFGLWQINASNGALATLNPFQNAKSAVELSNNGTNWGPWTTYTSGAYAGRC